MAETPNDTSSVHTEDMEATPSKPEETSGEPSVQLEPSQNEMERERLQHQAETLQDEIALLRRQLYQKELELGEVKKQLGITPLTELKQSMQHGFDMVGNKWKEVTDTPTYKKIDETLTTWKTKVQDSEAYQKTKATFSEGGKKASDALSSAGTKIKENETVKSFGEKTSAAFKRTGTYIKEKGTVLKTKVMSSMDGTDSPASNEETVVHDEPASSK
ncbi:hypothetical protein EMCRGX_G014689 [Ephydatia muelleri]|eukprot:Em0005g1279a